MPISISDLIAAPTTAEWRASLWIFISLIAAAAASEGIRKQFRWPAEVTRKLIHVSVGVLIFFSPLLFRSPLLPMIFSASAAIAMFAAVRAGFLTGLHGTARASYGTVWYPLAMLVLTVLFWNSRPSVIAVSMLGFAVGDAAAACAGYLLRPVTEFHLTSDKKTVEGSVTMAVASFVTVFNGLLVFGYTGFHPIEYLLLTAADAAVVATVWEAISSRGLDNFSVPLSIAFVLSYFFVPSPFTDPYRFNAGLILGAVIAGASSALRFLNRSGSAAAFLLAVVVFGIGGWKWTAPMLAFFVLSSLLSKAGRVKKNQVEHVFEKSGVRDWGQVAANGGAGGIILLLQYWYGAYNFYPMYLGAVAAVTADTWGTEIGLWFERKPFLLTSWKRVDHGTSGAVSLPGFAGSVLGAVIIGAAAFPWVDSLRASVIAAAAGIVGCLADSLLGCTLQAVYRCHVCDKMTERVEHCDTSTVKVSGLRWMTNDRVNWFCAIAGACTAWLAVSW